MRGSDSFNESLFTTVRLEDFVPANHPLRPIRTWMNEALAAMDERFSAMYEADVRGGRPTTGRPRTGVASGAATRPTNRRPTPMRCCIARAMQRPRCRASSGTS